MAIVIHQTCGCVKRGIHVYVSCSVSDKLWKLQYVIQFRCKEAVLSLGWCSNSFESNSRFIKFIHWGIDSKEIIANLHYNYISFGRYTKTPNFLYIATGSNQSNMCSSAFIKSKKIYSISQEFPKTFLTVHYFTLFRKMLLTWWENNIRLQRPIFCLKQFLVFNLKFCIIGKQNLYGFSILDKH